MNLDARIPESYSTFLKEHFKGGPKYPLDSPGFNMSFIKYNNKYIFVIRNVIPIKNLIEKKELKPGISKLHVKFIQNMKNFNVRNSDFSDYFFWDWQNFYNNTTIFAGKIDDKLNIIVDKNIKPYSFENPRTCLNYKENGKISCSLFLRNQEDFRIYTYRKRIYLIDSMVNDIYQIILKNNEFKIFKKFRNICTPIINLDKFGLNYSNLSNNIVLKNLPKEVNNDIYLKFFEKNWSLFSVKFENNKESLFSFFHDFGENGIEAVDYNPITKRCKKRIIVKYSPNTFPLDRNIVRFSFGSTTTFFKSKTRNGFLGVGHVKIRAEERKSEAFVPKEHNNSQKNKIGDYFSNIYFTIHKFYKKIFKEKYKPHPLSQYTFFFFLYDNNSKKFYISDLFLPIIKYKYYFTLVFAMSIITSAKDEYIVSMGYGDFTNILLKFSTNEIESSLKYDVENLDVTKLKLELLL